MRNFAIVWMGQLISLLGSALTRFALGVWVYSRTGSVTLFSTLLLAGALPSVLLGPVAGALVDRWPKRTVLLLGEVMCAAGLLLLLPFASSMSLSAITAVILMNGVATAFQEPAFAAVMAQMVSPEQLARANGMQQFGHAGSQVAAPLLGAAFLLALGLRSILLVDLASFAFSILVLLAMPYTETKVPARTQGPSLRAELGEGLSVIRARPALARLLLVYGSVNLCAGLAQAVFTPMVLGFTSTAGLGAIMSAGGLGMIAGSVLMTIRGNPQRVIGSILFAIGMLGGSMVIGGIQANVAAVAAANFGMMFTLPLINGYDAAIWQLKVEPELHGRVFALRNMIASFTLPVAYAVAGPLVARVVAPLLAWRSIPPGIVAFLGGPGRESAAVLMVVGVAIVGVSLLAWSSREIRGIDGLLDAGARAVQSPLVGSITGTRAPE
jgi:MFS family permease